MKNIIITGASGLVASELTRSLLKCTDTNLYLLSTHTDAVCERYKEYGDRVKCFTLDDFESFALTGNVKFDFCIHTAFSRTPSGNLIVESINYQRALISILKKTGVGVFANISSQSVYGKISEPLWTEDAPLDPDYLYAMGKYFSEIVTQQMFEGTRTKWTNIRLCSVCEKARFVYAFVKNAIERKPIVLTAPKQQCSFIDVRDVATGLMSFIEAAERTDLSPVYNLGANLVNTIGEAANIVKTIAEKKYGLKEVIITEQDSTNENRIGMDATLFMDTFSWKPQFDLEGMIIEIFESLINSNKTNI